MSKIINQGTGQVWDLKNTFEDGHIYTGKHMSRRVFLSTLVWLILVNLVIKAIFIFGIDLQVQNRVGQSDYGLYFTLLNLCYIFQIINDFGLNLLHGTDTAKRGSINIRRWVQILKMKFMLALFYSVIVAIVALILGYGDVWKLLLWLIINNILVSFILVLRAGISGMGKYSAEAFISILDKALMILLCGFLLISLSDFKIVWFVWAQTASLLLTAAVALIITLRMMKTSPVDKDESLDIIFKSTIPFTLASLLMFIYSRSDSILIEQLLPDGTHHVGVYAAGFRLLDAANMLAYLFSPLLIPMFARLMQDKAETIQLLKLSGSLMIVITFFIAFTCFWWGGPIMQLLYRDADATWIQTFRWLILSHIPIGLMYVFGSYLTATSQMRKQNILFICSVALSIITNLIVIPRWGTVGAAVTAVVTQTFTTAGLIILVQRHLRHRMDNKDLFRLPGFCLIVIFSGWVLTLLPVYWMLQIIIFFGITAAAAFILKLVDHKGLLLKEISTHRTYS